jgi:hypothetical protein
MRAAILVLGLSSLAAAPGWGGTAEITVAVPNARGAPGEEVEVPVTVEGADRLGCLQMALEYDRALLEVRAVDRGPVLPEGALVEHDSKVPGRLGLGFLSGPNAKKTGLARVREDGVLFKVRFVVLGEAGQKSPLRPQLAQAWEVTDDKLEVRTEGGEFLITGAGDAWSHFPWHFVLFGAGACLLALVVGMRARRRA